MGGVINLAHPNKSPRVHMHIGASTYARHQLFFFSFSPCRQIAIPRDACVPRLQICGARRRSVPIVMRIHDSEATVLEGRKTAASQLDFACKSLWFANLEARRRRVLIKVRINETTFLEGLEPCCISAWPRMGGVIDLHDPTSRLVRKCALEPPLMQGINSSTKIRIEFVVGTVNAY